MDRIEFELLDNGYQEDRQRLYDQTSAEKSPPFDQRLQEVEQGYYQRLQVISQSGYTPMERQRLEQQELEIFQANQKQINDERESVIETVMAPLDTELQKLAFGRESREEAEQEMLAYERSLEEAQEEANAEAELMEDNTIPNTALEDEAMVNEHNRNWEAGDVSQEFNEKADPGGPPPPGAGMEH